MRRARDRVFVDTQVRREKTRYEVVPLPSSREDNRVVYSRGNRWKIRYNLPENGLALHFIERFPRMDLRNCRCDDWHP